MGIPAADVEIKTRCERLSNGKAHSSELKYLEMEIDLDKLWDFTQVQQILARIAPQIEKAGVEAQVYYYLELGRTACSAAHPADLLTDKARVQARHRSWERMRWCS